MDISKKKVIQGVISPFIDILKNQPACAFEDHGDLFIDFGWDVAEGDGRICSSVRSLFKDYISTLPPTLRSWLWWQTSSGRLEEEYIFKSFDETPPYLDDLEQDTYEQAGQTIEFLMDNLRSKAELAFSKYQESEY